MTTVYIILAVFFGIIALAILIAQYFIMRTVIKVALHKAKKTIKDHPLAKDIDPEFFEQDLSIKQIRNKALKSVGKKVVEKVKDEINTNKN